MVSALRPRRCGGPHSRRKCTPSTSTSVVTRVRGPVSTAAASSPTPDHHAGADGDPRAEVAQQAPLADLGHGGAAVQRLGAAGLAHRERVYAGERGWIG